MKKQLLLALLVAAGGYAVSAGAQARVVPTPASVIGWEPGDDRKIADSGQIATYFKALAEAAPDRIQVVQIGTSVEKRPLLMAIISGEENLRNLARYREIARALAMGRVGPAEVRTLAREGRAILLVDHAIHGTEPASGDSSLLLAHRLVTGDDDDVRAIRENAIVLLTPCINPDGRDRFLAWYRKNVGTRFETATLPYLDNPYVGHENNRDMFMLATPEMQALAKVLWHDWHPQAVLDLHQGVPYPARIFMPPFQEPFNPNIPSLTARSVSAIGSAMAVRFEQEGKPGAISRATYTSWMNGPVDASSTLHNQVGVLVEVQQRPATWATPGDLSPDEIPKVFSGLAIPTGVTPAMPSVVYPNPWKGGRWTYRDQVEYTLTSSIAFLEIGARLKQQWLTNVWQVARDNIERGKKGQPFAYVLPAEQWDAGQAVELVNALKRAAIEVHRATAPFKARGTTYPAGSYIAYAGQAFRNALVDVMEPQHHPDLRLYPGGPPIPPYDQSAWTLPMAMGVRAVRFDDPFDAAAVLEPGPAVRKGQVTGGGPAYLFSTQENDGFKALNRLWAAGATVSRATAPLNVSGGTWPAGTFVVRSDPTTLRPVAESTGVSFVGIGRQSVTTATVKRPRLGVYQSYVVSTHNPDEGWTRWVLEAHGFEYTTLKDLDIRSGDLTRFDTIVLPDQQHADDILNGFPVDKMRPEYAGGVGAEGAANLKRFVERGGTLVALSEASTFAIAQLGLPVRNAVEKVPPSALLVPGSLLRASVDNTHALAYGMPPEAAVMYYRRHARNQLAFAIAQPGSDGDVGATAVSVPVRFADANVLMSGWGLGVDQHLAGTPAVVQVSLGSGRAILVNFRPQFRNQARGTFKVLFNALLAGSTSTATTSTAR
jgi:hypothetical protein